MSFEREEMSESKLVEVARHPGALHQLDTKALDAGIAVTHTVPIRLTEGRRLEILEEYHEAGTMKATLDTQLQEMKENNKAAQKIQQRRQDQASTALVLGHEMFRRDCRKFFDVPGNQVVLKDAQTGDVLERHAMTAEDHREVEERRNG